MFNFLNIFNSNPVYYKTIRELGALSDCQLKDIGVDRSEIHSLALKAQQEHDFKQSYDPAKHYLRGRKVATWKGKSHA